MSNVITTTRQLEVVQAYATHVINGHILRDQLGFEQYIRAILPMEMDNLVVSLLALFAAENIKNIVIKTPINWWEHLKEEKAPLWFLVRWPVQYSTRTIDIKAIWQGFHPPPADKYGPFLAYVHETTF